MRSASAIGILGIVRAGIDKQGGGLGKEDRVDDELIRWCALATRAACSRMTAQQLKALQDSVGQARCLPARLSWDRKATAHVQIYTLLADVIADRQGAAMLLNASVGTIHDLMLTVGPAADGLILSSRRRLLDLIRVGDADGAAAEMEQHLRRLHFMWRLSRSSQPRGIAV
jgi:DNA-binding FadR family transcriptional regulator